ncbi:MFS transporter [Burkholderia thailandensis]|uniref:MFS transporter n=1 Tax=Burkholderia thailandensis TaxID=57975 RepID=UPI00192E1A6C|nr:MFS transporter [Burkholderia thailandensis]QRA09893.1 MFS transporter [Burkholderia thailandensis]
MTMSWTREQRNVTIAAYLGWTLDAFDFFLMVFVLKDIAAEFNTKIPAVAFAITLTLAARPIGALIFGRLADHFGRRPTLMINIACYSLLEPHPVSRRASPRSLVLRTLFGIAMGGEWGVGSALTMETIPPRARGAVSGLLQAGYPSGYLLASVVFGLFYQYIGWRGMFMIGVLPALLVLYVRAKVPESPAWRQMEKKRARPSLVSTLKQNWKLSIYAVVLMTAFNFFSHGTQDLYPTFLREQHHFDPHTVSWITIVLNVGAIAGGHVRLAVRAHRPPPRDLHRRADRAARAAAVGVLDGALALAAGAFLMQISVQGAWGVIPVHLNEISPDEIRATFPGFVYQLGNLLASGNATMQAQLAVNHGNDYSTALATVAGTVAVVICVLIVFSRERRGIDMTQTAKMGRRPDDLARRGAPSRKRASRYAPRAVHAASHWLL